MKGFRVIHRSENILGIRISRTIKMADFVKLLMEAGLGDTPSEASLPLSSITRVTSTIPASKSVFPQDRELHEGKDHICFVDYRLFRAQPRSVCLPVCFLIE